MHKILNAYLQEVLRGFKDVLVTMTSPDTVKDDIKTGTPTNKKEKMPSTAPEIIDIPTQSEEEMLHVIQQQSIGIDGKKRSVNDSPVHIVGAFLGKLFQNHTLPSGCSSSLTQSTLYSPLMRTKSVSFKYEFSQSLHYCPHFSQGELIRTIIGLYNTVPETMGTMLYSSRGIPECFDIVRCQSTTTEEELRLFLTRASQYPRLYIVLEVNKLPYNIQEVSLR